MSGSAATPFIVPFIMVGLAIWLALVFYADAHPRRAGREAATGREVTQADSAAISEGNQGDTFDPDTAAPRAA